MKLTASLFFYRTSQVPALGAAQAARTRAVPLCRFATFPPPRGGIVPNTPRPFLFLLEEKEAKDYLGGAPPKDPQGERSGRPARGPSPFVALRHFPRTAGESSPYTPTAGILCGSSRRIESQYARSCCRKILLFVKLFHNRATVRQAVSPVLGADSLGTSACNLTLFCANLAGC